VPECVSFDYMECIFAFISNLNNITGKNVWVIRNGYIYLTDNYSFISSMFELPEGTSLLQSPYVLDNDSKL